MIAWPAFDGATIALAAVFGVAALLASVRVWRRARRHRALLLLLQWPLAGLMLAALLLRGGDGVEVLTVLTAGATGSEASADGRIAIALPGANAPASIAHAPDLATALRRHPAVRQLHVIGDGLAEHDREAIGTRAVSFSPSPAATPGTLVALDAPARAVPGAYWRLHGRVAPGSTYSVALIDPAGTPAARATPDSDGRFALQGLARAAGAAMFRLHVLDGDRVAQDVPLPVFARTPEPLRVHVLASAPSPELRALRRWALDAGVELGSRIDLAPGLPQRRGAAALDAKTLADLDLLVVDERSWSLVAAQREMLRDAIADGLGLLVRITGPVPTRAAEDWRSLGIDVRMQAMQPRAVSVSTPAGTASSDAPATQALMAWPARAEDADSVTLLAATDGAPLAWRRVSGRGRIGVWALADSFRLAARGDAVAHASLWSVAVGDIARARATSEAALPTRAVVGERSVICAAASAMQVVTPTGQRVALVADANADNCAAFWPRESGWHRLLLTDGDADPGNRESDETDRAPMFRVYARGDVASLSREDTRNAMAALAQPVDASEQRAASPAKALTLDGWRAALLIAWLVLACLVWWLERRTRLHTD